MIFTGEHQAAAALHAGVFDGAAEQSFGAALAALGGEGIDTEDHLPGAMLLVEGGIFVHFVR